jgi:hypothetical protein
MPSDPHNVNPEELEREIKDSIEKVREMTDEFKIVQEHESSILRDSESPGRATK